MSAALVAFGGAIGAVSRYALERYATRHRGERVPYGTLVANLIGAFLIGVFAGLHARDIIGDDLLLLLGTGYCGALTTFSGFMGQVWSRLRHQGARRLAVDYLVGSLFAGYALVMLGWTLATGIGA